MSIIAGVLTFDRYGMTVALHSGDSSPLHLLTDKPQPPGESAKHYSGGSLPGNSVTYQSMRLASTSGDLMRQSSIR